MDFYEIAEQFKEIALFLEFQSSPAAHAYRKAARTLETLSENDPASFHPIWEELPGIGKKMAMMISELLEDRPLLYYQKLQSQFPLGLWPLLKLPRLGIEKIRRLHIEYGIQNIIDLENACKQGTLLKIKGFGPKAIDYLLKAIEKQKNGPQQLLFSRGQKMASSLCRKLHPCVTQIEIAGALRRKLEVISDIVLIAVSANPQEALQLFKTHSFIKEIRDERVDGLRVLLKQGIEAQLFFVSSGDFWWQLFLHTGNSTHVHAITAQLPSPVPEMKQEEVIYTFLNMVPIVPELREGLGEIEAAQQKRLPHLIEKDDLRGAFHCHTTDSDGKNSLEEMVNAAHELGWDYIGISDHSKSSYQANGMSEERLFNQIEAIQNLRNEECYIFSGIECDILKNGELDFSNDVLKHLDFVIASIHRFFQLEKSEQTNRLIKAIENPYVTMIGHLTGRILLYRDPYAIDVMKIIDACIANGKVMELNAYPNRLDMDWRYWQKAHEKGLKCSINPDAHSIQDLNNCTIGIQIARKGWLEKKNVINTFPLKKIKGFLKKR